MVKHVPQTTPPRQATKSRVIATATSSTEQLQTELLPRRWTLLCTQQTPGTYKTMALFTFTGTSMLKLNHSDTIARLTGTKEQVTHCRMNSVWIHANVWIACTESMKNFPQLLHIQHASKLSTQQKPWWGILVIIAQFLSGALNLHTTHAKGVKMHAHRVYVYLHYVQQLCTCNEQCRMP